MEDTKVVKSQQDEYVVSLSVPNPPEWPPRWTFSSCVEFVKYLSGHKGETWGWAGKIKPTSEIPHPGGIVLTKEGGGHIALITKVSSSSISIIEANYIAGQVSTRSLDLDSPLIRGFK